MPEFEDQRAREEKKLKVQKEGKSNEFLSPESGRVEAILFSAQAHPAVPPLTSPEFNPSPLPVVVHRHQFHQLAINFNLKPSAKPLAPLAD